MKRILFLLCALMLSTELFAQFTQRQIADLKERRRDSLTIKYNASPFGARDVNGLPTGASDGGDTIRLVGQVVWDGNQSFITRNASGLRTRVLMYLADTTRGPGNTTQLWGGATVNDITDTTGGVPVDSSLLVDTQAGDIVRLTMRLREPFGTPARYFETLELDKINTISLQVIGNRPIPAPVVIPIDSLFNSDGTIRMEAGEKYDGMLVTVTGNFTASVSSNVLSLAPGRYPTWWLQSGNIRLAFGDNSANFRTRNAGGNIPIIAGSNPDSVPATGRIPVNGATVTSITGIIGKVQLAGFADNQSQGWTGNGRTYRIHARSAADIVIQSGSVPPQVRSVTRGSFVGSPSAPTTVTINTREVNPSPANIASVQVFFNTTSSIPTAAFGGPYTPVAATRVNSGSDTLWTAQIPAQPEGTYVNYVVRATSSTGTVVGFPDTTAATSYRFLYRSTANPQIRDVQFTPYSDNRSPALGLNATVTGVAVMDSSDFLGGLFIQDQPQPWSGVQALVSTWRVSPTDSIVKGDSVRLTGLVQEQFGFTRIDARTTVSGAAVAKLGVRPRPAAQVLTPLQLATNSESFEGMFVQVNTVSVTGNNPDGSPGFGEFTVNADTLALGYRVDDLSGWAYRGIAGAPANASARIVVRGDRFASLNGIHNFANNNYKLIPPRTNGFTGFFSSVVMVSNTKPQTFALGQNYPNPFNPSTAIKYQIPAVSDVRLEIFDLLGRKVSTLVSERQAAGSYQATFNAANFASGVYFYRLQAGSFVETKKMLLVK
jgi:hypothetical protein